MMNAGWDTEQASAARATAPYSSWRRVVRLARKELREILRDRRTIVTLIAMPLLLYPLMSVAFQQFYLASRITPDQGQEFRLAALSNAEVSAFEQRFDQGQKAWRRQRMAPAKGLAKPKANSQLVWFMDPVRPRTAQERAEVLDRLKQWLHEEKIDLIIEMPEADPDKDIRDTGADQFFSCRIYYLSNSAIGRAALAYVETVFAAANEKNLKQRLNLPGAFPHIVMLGVQRVPLEVSGSDGVISLAALVPLILILMTITGAVYPAIDLTAGERERGTLEILVAAPVSRFELLSAKYVSVVTVAVLNAIVNLICMSITVTWSGLGSVLFHEGGLSPILLMQIFALLLLFAGFFSAVLLCLTSFARSFKEAQAYLIPLMLASLAPGIMAMMPGLKLEGILSVLPLVNIVLLARDLFSGDVDPLIATIVVMTTAMYALAALALAARVFGDESVLYSEQSSWSDLVRRPEAPQPTATIPAALWCLALMVPVQFSLIALLRALQSEWSFTPVAGVALQVGINTLLFGFLPGLFLYLGRVRLGSGLGLIPPGPAGLAAGLMLGASLWPLELFLLSQNELSAVLKDHFGTVLEDLQKTKDAVGWMILAVVIVPAILEEFFFRGMLFNALKSRCGAWLTIGVSGLLFGMTHVALGGALGLDRLVPSTLLGIILGVVCWRSGSIWPSLLQHACHNAILLAIGIYDPGSTHQISWYWLAGSGIGVLFSALLLWPWRRKAKIEV